MEKEYGNNLLDDFTRMFQKRVKFRLGAFNPWCLTITGALSLLVTLIFAFAALDNILLPHYEEIAYSVQTRCKIEKISNDPLIGSKMKHFAVKFPLPGIPGFRNGEALCYESQPCIEATDGEVVDCFFNTQDHVVRLSTALSGHKFIKLLSYIILIVPFCFGAVCCLIFASRSWRTQWFTFSDWFSGIWKSGFRSCWDRDKYDDDSPRKQAPVVSPPPVRVVSGPADATLYGAAGGAATTFYAPPPPYPSTGGYQQVDAAPVRSTAAPPSGYLYGAAGAPPASPYPSGAGYPPATPASAQPNRMSPAPPARASATGSPPAAGGGSGFMTNNVSWLRMQMGV